MGIPDFSEKILSALLWYRGQKRSKNSAQNLFSGNFQNGHVFPVPAHCDAPSFDIFVRRFRVYTTCKCCAKKCVQYNIIYDIPLFYFSSILAIFDQGLFTLWTGIYPEDLHYVIFSGSAGAVSPLKSHFCDFFSICTRKTSFCRKPTGNPVPKSYFSTKMFDPGFSENHFSKFFWSWHVV